MKNTRLLNFPSIDSGNPDGIRPNVFKQKAFLSGCQLVKEEDDDDDSAVRALEDLNTEVKLYSIRVIVCFLLQEMEECTN